MVKGQLVDSMNTDGCLLGNDTIVAPWKIQADEMQSSKNWEVLPIYWQLILFNNTFEFEDWW